MPAVFLISKSLVLISLTVPPVKKLVTLAFVKYKLVVPSLRSSVSLLAKSVLKLLVAYPLIVVGSNLLLPELYART